MYMVLLFTCCDSGFDNRLALRLNQKGFRVYATVLDTNYCGSKELTEKCADRDRMSVIQMDVTKDVMINECFETVKKELDKNGEVLWALVNNAGIASWGHTIWGQFEEYHKVFEVNTFGVVRVTRKFAPLIIKSQGMLLNKFEQQRISKL